MDTSMIRAVIKNLNLMPLITFIVGFFIGLVIFGWGLTPVDYVDATPQELRTVDYQQFYLRGLADQYAQNQLNADQARAALDAANWADSGIALCDAVNRAASGSTDADGNLIVLPNPAARDRLEKLVEVLGQGNCATILANAGANPDAPLPANDAAQAGGGLARWLTSLGWLLVLLLLVGAFWWFWNNNSDGYDDDEGLLPINPPGGRASAASSSVAAAPSAKADYLDDDEVFESSASSSSDSGSGGVIPISTYRTTYNYGQDAYDDSFSIENSAGEFLGECGVGISETVGSGGSRAVTALEVWLFDKNDIRTITKVAMSENTFMDEALKAKLEPKGEPVLVGEDEVIVLETASLIINAKVNDMSYGSDPNLPENSYFDRLSFEIMAWAKNDGETADDGFDFD